MADWGPSSQGRKTVLEYRQSKVSWPSSGFLPNRGPRTALLSSSFDDQPETSAAGPSRWLMFRQRTTNPHMVILQNQGLCTIVGLRPWSLPPFPSNFLLVGVLRIGFRKIRPPPWLLGLGRRKSRTAFTVRRGIWQAWETLPHFRMIRTSTSEPTSPRGVRAPLLPHGQKSPRQVWSATTTTRIFSFPRLDRRRNRNVFPS